MTIYDLRRPLRWVRSNLLGQRPYQSRVRRIDRVCLPGQRVVAITFDDGPTAGLTESLLETLGRHGARGTFNVIGSTAANYPDRPGKVGTAFWSGRRSDHYAAFGRDAEAGVEAQPELVRRIVAQGHELSNHSYRHIAFGRENLVYRGRDAFPSAQAALDDQRRLHALCHDLTESTMRLGRPPHYINRTLDGYTAFHIYDAMGYQYLAASFDLGGWQPTRGGLAQAVEEAVAPLRAALATNPDALCGQILFAKDGLNMSLHAVAPAALPAQLELLSSAGYRVITVSELTAQSPFADVDPGAPEVAWAQALGRVGVPVGNTANRLGLDAPLSRGELAAWLAGPMLPPALADAAKRLGPLPPDAAGHRYRRSIATCLERGWLHTTTRFGPEEAVDRSELEDALGRWDWKPLRPGTAAPAPAGPAPDGPVTHRVALHRFATALGDRAAPGFPLPLIQ